MKTFSGLRIGPGMASLLMILVTLLMAALALLAMVGAKNDAALSRRNVDMAKRYYEAAERMQKKMAEVDYLIMNARKAAEGDLDEYARMLADMQADSPPGDEWEASTGILLALTEPMENDFHLESILEAPLALTGSRYVVLSHKVVDDAYWEDAFDLNLFTF